MAQRNEQYPAKLLLFGEYSVLNGSQALAVPLKQYFGQWKTQNGPDKEEPNISLNNFIIWLEENELISHDVLQLMQSDLENGLYYQSSIPQGYGIGSSGAIVAALYDRYFLSDDDINAIQSTMSKMESYFHGTSSGLDPLISYTQKAVYKDESGGYHSLTDPRWPEGYKIYLLDSEVGRETGTLVQKYKEKLLDPVFEEKIQRQYIPMVEHAIHFYLAGENRLLEECLSIISQFQREYFTEMIPDHVKKRWDELVNKPGVYVKLCGAGGGGYFMIITSGHLKELSFTGLITLC
ncbi:MAG: hypothetical protein ABIQ02_10000 [Saprospiraceae bacterium]